jgi:hypothetical protein
MGLEKIQIRTGRDYSEVRLNTFKIVEAPHLVYRGIAQGHHCVGVEKKTPLAPFCHSEQPGSFTPQAALDPFVSQEASHIEDESGAQRLLQCQRDNRGNVTAGMNDAKPFAAHQICT